MVYLNQMFPTYEPVSDVEKESAESLADYDMSIGSPTLEQDGQALDYQVDKWFEEAFGALKKVVKHRQIISKRQMILFSHVRRQLHSHICKKQVMTEAIS